MLRSVPPPDELSRAGVEHVDAAAVAGYDRKSGFDPTDDLAELRRLGLRGATLVDVGAGTGTLALAAAGEAARVVAVDVSPLMVATVRERVTQRGIRNVEAVEAGFLTYVHTGSPADIVYTRNALHHLPDFWKAIALRRLAATLRPGGTLLLRDIIFSFDVDDTDACLSEWLDGAVADPRAGWTRDDLVEHVRSEHSTFSWLLEPLLERAGFTIERAEYGRARAYAAYVCTRVDRAARG